MLVESRPRHTRRPPQALIAFRSPDAHHSATFLAERLILRFEIEEKEVHPRSDDFGVLRFPVVGVRNCDHMRPVPHLLLGNFSLLSFGNENFDVLRCDANRFCRAYLVQVHDPEVGIVNESFSECITHLTAQFFE